MTSVKYFLFCLDWVSAPTVHATFMQTADIILKCVSTMNCLVLWKVQFILTKLLQHVEWRHMTLTDIWHLKSADFLDWIIHKTQQSGFVFMLSPHWLLIRVMQSEQAALWECTHCNKEFRYESEKRRHEQSHIPQFECKVCSKKFSFLWVSTTFYLPHIRYGLVTVVSNI